MTRSRRDKPQRPAANKKVANGLMALSSAAVLTVYAAGYLRTRAAAQRFTETPAVRRAAGPVEVPAAGPVLPALKPISQNIRQPESAATTAAPAERPAPKSVAPRESVRRTTPTAAEKPVERVVAQPTETPAAASPAPPPAPSVAPPSPAEPPAAVPPPAAPTAPARPPLKDGTYSGWGTSRHGDIQATVVVENGRISSAVISQCLTRYSCSWIAALPPQVVTRQSPETDYVSGATQSTNAFYYAVVEALTKAK
jgi:uncharacterized protein with FMN-binding domain